MQAQLIDIKRLSPNKGQIAGVPANPRFIRDERFEKLKESIKSDPEMMQVREIVAYDNGGELVVVMGNMRYRASNFVLTGIRKNKSILRFPTGDTIAAITLETCPNSPQVKNLCAKIGIEDGYHTRNEWINSGGRNLYPDSNCAMSTSSISRAERN